METIYTNFRRVVASEEPERGARLVGSTKESSIICKVDFLKT